MRFLTNEVKKKIRARKKVIGSWLNLPSIEVAEIMARNQFEFLVIDAEHGSAGLELTQKMVSVIEGWKVIPLVRVEENNPIVIKKTLETGCYGIIVPMVNTRDDARRAAESISYAPDGIRGVGLSRAQGYGLEFAKYKKWYKNNILLITQIEHIQAIENLEDILSVDGIDATIIGPYDLSSSLGYAGEFEKKEVKNAFLSYVNICKKYRKPMGIHVINPDAKEVNKRIAEGFNFIVFSLDMLFLGKKIQTEFERIQKQ